jgi:hypothetical protein
MEVGQFFLAWIKPTAGFTLGRIQQVYFGLDGRGGSDLFAHPKFQVRLNVLTVSAASRPVNQICNL